MKKNLLLLFSMVFLSYTTVSAELPYGAAAQDWTLTDLNSNTHNLYSYLDSGKPVIIDFSATWCPPCWSYHQTGVLEDLYNNYGPSGSDEIMVFLIEPDGSTNTACLYGPSGCSGGTMGDWVSGTPYPIIDLTGSTLSVASAYNITYYPTLYAISPDRRAWEVGQITSPTVWDRWLFESFSLAVDVANIAPSTCGNNGTIDLSTTGGYGNLNYYWDNGMNGASISGLSGGSYTVNISDAQGYFISKTYTVDGPLSGQTLGMDILSQIDVVCNGESNGSLDIQATNGNYGYSYNWNTGNTGPTVSNLTAGTYTVSITDAENCLTAFDIEVEEPGVLTTTIDIIDDACGQGNGEIFFTPEGGTGSYYFDLGTGPLQQIYFTNFSAGNYQFTQTDDNGCENFGSFEVVEFGTPVAVAEATGNLDCINTSVSVSGDGSSSGNIYSYQWTTTNGNITSSPTMLDITVDQPGDYTLNITNTGYGCMASATTTVNEVASAPVADAGTSTPVTCNIPVITLDGSGSDTGANITYQWTSNDGTIVSGGTGLTPSVSAAGTYTLAVTNTTNGCISTSDVVVPSDFAQPSIMAVDGEITCTTTNVEICATVESGVIVNWATENGNVTANCITVSASGTYTATAMGTNGCTATATATVTQSADIPQTAIASPAMITCSTPEITLAGSLTGDINDHTITWTTVSGSIVSGANTLTPIVDKGGTYVMSAVNTTNGCSSQVSATVASNISLPVAGFSFNSAIGSLDLTNASTNNSGDITWDLGNGQTATGSTVQTTYDETGIYTVCVTVNNDCGSNTLCQDIQYITVMTFDQTATNVKCNAATDGTITVTPQGGLPAYSIAWTGPNGFTSTELTIANLAAGTYNMTLNDAGGNSSTEQYIITEPSVLNLSASATDVACNGGNDGILVANADGGTEPYTFDLGVADPTKLPAGTYPVMVTDANGCVTQSSAEIKEPAALANNSVDVSNASAGQSDGTITIEPLGGTGVLKVEWSNGMTGSSITGLPAGDYTATITDENGCTLQVGPFTVKSISGIADLDFVKKFSLNPNPASQMVYVNVDLNRAVTSLVTIKNVVGQTVYDQKFFDTSSIHSVIDVTGFKAGMYILTLASDQSQASHKFIVIK